MRNRPSLKPIALNAGSYDVALLHQALQALGLQVTSKEVAAGKAGKDTLEKVRMLQARLNVPVDESVVVNGATARAIGGELEERGLLEASRAFTVTGTVRLRNREVKKRQQLMAFDLDLRGVAVYRTVKKVADLKKNGGFEYLGQTVSGSKGEYQLTFYDWQYRLAERKKADVVVYAVEGEDVIGRSRLVNAGDYSDEGLLRGLDVYITRRDTRTEYEILMGLLNAFMKESDTTLGAIVASRDQLIFTAGELDINLWRLHIAASAELLAQEKRKRLSHELLYGIGRQNIRLSWAALYKQREEDLRDAIAKSVEQRIIRKFSERDITEFLREVREGSSIYLLDDSKATHPNTLNAMLSNALPTEKQRLSFVHALRSFEGSDFSEFWRTHLPNQPEFKNKPRLISALLLTQQLTLISGNHQALVKELQVSRKINSTRRLFQLKRSDWVNIVKKTGVPDFIHGDGKEEKRDQYIEMIETTLNAAFPTQRIASMLEKKELIIEKSKVAQSILTFLSKNEDFDIARSRIHQFDDRLKTIAGREFGETRSELMKIQRVFQVSPSPEAMNVLLENKLHSAYTIANIPLNSFLKTYGPSLGGEEIAFAVHQRASHIGTKAEFNATQVIYYSHSKGPQYTMDKPGYTSAMATIENQVPNYATLFGSPDICECEQCRSVYSAAAYFIDLLRFLWRGEPNGDGETPLDKLSKRRPDLLHLPLTCENTNTVIPYIDLANEVMEFYTANDSLASFKGYDTGETTAEELRANPQNFNLEAYRKLKDAKYPFTLPYHQPLDVMRTYGDQFKVKRYDAMKAINPQPDATTRRAIEAESLALCQEEYSSLTGEAFDGTPDTTALHKYFGYNSASDLEKMSGVREFLRRSGLAYTDLVELVKSSFINPHQGTLDFLQKLFSFSLIDADAIYTKLEQIEAETLNPANDLDIVVALNAYNSDSGTSVTPAQFAKWVMLHLDEFRQVITLYQPESKCELDTTTLRTLESIYESSSSSGISSDSWSKIHRFIRFWRKLGWKIHETDLMLAALGEDEIRPETISKLESVSQLKAATKLAPDQLAVFWGSIDAYGKKSLYKKLFLSRAAQQIDEAFKADAWGNYLTDETEILADHQSAIIAAFKIREEELTAILAVARVIDGGNPRPLVLEADTLNIQNLSTIYRYVLLAKGLKMRVTELCKLISLFGAAPFSTWDIQQQEFINISPATTYAFYKLAAATKEAGFKSSVLEYILQGTLPADSNIGLDRAKILQTAKDIRTTFAAIEQDHPQTPEAPLTSAALAAEMALTFQPEIVSRFIQILESTSAFETTTDANLNVTIPDDLAVKYSYVRGSGRLTCTGVMSDDEQTTLKGLPGVNADFQAAVGELYAAPETFIHDNFGGVFDDLAETYRTLLDHPEQNPAATLDDKLAYVYERFVPILKDKLRHDAITRYIAALIGLTEEATALLIADDTESLITELSLKGYSANYFSDATWSNTALERTDGTIDFSWGADSPDTLVPADNFSVRWKAYLEAPASGEYTMVVETAQSDEAFNLHLDEALILQKLPGDIGIAWEVVTALNAAQMHALTLEYSEATQQAGIRLSWKRPTTALEIIPDTAAYPAAILDDFVELATLFHRAAKFILGFELSETELNQFITFNDDFGGIDFKALDAGDWERIYDYVTLRNAVPQAQALLTDVFALAGTPNPSPTLDDLRAMLHLATAWDEASTQFLVDTHFALSVDDFRNEIALKRLHDVIKVVSMSGLSASTIAVWGEAETDFDTLHGTAQVLKNGVKAKFEEQDWLEVAGGLSDKIREHQKEALISYLLTKPAIQAWGATDADGLFEYFLIDVQMGACMDTSRIVQANSSVQMFVNRCLLNLESDMSSGVEEGVSPSAIDTDRWEWMKNYRVWEANRKVFLYPENWLEPEWRNDRSQFFKELESYLVQNDITDRSVEQAFRNYMTSLNEVANLEVCGLYRENNDDGSSKADDLKCLHVFARTHNAPYKFFYRTWNEYRKWSAWEKVAVDIRNVENGDQSGVHLIPVVWKKRLFLFWPEFIAKQESPSSNASKSVKEAWDDQMSTLHPREYWEIRLAWSEYVDGKWSPKQVSKEYLEQNYYEFIQGEASTRFATVIDEDQKLRIHFVYEAYGDLKLWYIGGYFELADITSKVRAENSGLGWAYEKWQQTYSASFMNVAGYSNLELLGHVYLKAAVDHKLLLSSEVENYAPSFKTPFFYYDAYRNYFVRPVSIRILEAVKDPGISVFIPEYVDDSGFSIPIDIPHYGPDDYIPGDMIIESFALEEVYFDSSIGAGGAPVKNFSGPGNARAPLSRTSARSNGSAMRAMRAVESMAAGNVGMQTMAEMESVAGAFAGITDMTMGTLQTSFTTGTGLEFHTFHHPFSGRYVTHLNKKGLPGLMESDTTIPSDEGETFEDIYQPNFKNGFVQKPDDFAARTYYKENVCFDVYGANSIYNWELFFHAPLYIATRLSKNGKFEEALKWFHYIFDPTTDEMPAPGETEISRYWKVLPFKTTPAKSLEDWFRSLAPNTDPNNPGNAVIAEWRDNPFDPHLVASNRPLAYMKHVVIKYVENLIAWGDSLFRQDTMESVNEALQIYVIASHILGPYPEFVPKRGEIKAESYDSLRDKWDDFSNTLVQLENIFPYSSEVSSGKASTGSNLLGVGPALYFCIPANDKLLEVWDTVADRLFKIRHCQNIEGVERKLALFAPPIDPAALIQAASQGLSLGSILADLSSPPPIYRFTHLMQKANEFCAEVKGLGSALLAALEKKDAEELGRLRASHETQMLELMKAIKERQVLDARARKEGLEKSRQTASVRLQHYIELLGNDSVTVPAPPTISATLNAESQLPSDTSIVTVKTDVDESLAESGERGVKLISKEKEQLDKNEAAKWVNFGAGIAQSLAGVFHFIPQFDAEGTPFGVGAGAWWGGQNLGAASAALGQAASIAAGFLSQEATQAGLLAGYIRREQDWTLQANLAAREIVQLDKQITSADIQIQVAEKELENQQVQIENSKQVELFLQDKFTNQELYQWMKEQLFAVYKQSYNLAYDMAKKAEKAYKYEMGTETASFIQYGYWDNSKEGLVSGEKLQLALRQLEKSYLEANRRELELTKSISLMMLNPLALIKLREKGKCFVSLPEEIFDLDFQGHYFRRIKSVSLSIPCVVGPYTTVNCSLRLLRNHVRINTSMNSAGGYEHENDEGLWIDDDRFRSSNVPVTSIATSTAQNDSGLFEFSFRDERYLPFEGSGAISEWLIELSTDDALRQFDYSTISDVILQLRFTARENSGLFKEKAADYIKSYLTNIADLTEQPLMRAFSMKHEFPTEWHMFLHPVIEDGEQVLSFTLEKEQFPFFTQGRTIIVMKLEVFAKCTKAGDYIMILSLTNPGDDVITSSNITMPTNDSYGGLKKATIASENTVGLNLEDLKIGTAVSLKLKHTSAPDFQSLAAEPSEVEDIFLVAHYKLE